jgi:uncharacterized membrane protein
VITDVRTRSAYAWGPWIGWPGVFVVLCSLAFVLFTLMPGTVEGKSLAVLHGLCAQQPTHSYYYGEARLPFDARMTGIYSGFALTGAYLALRSRWRCAEIPEARIAAVLVLLILPLVVDGGNSLLKDIQLPYLYEPHNIVRTITGLMLGTSLSTFVWLLVSQTAFRPSERSLLPIWKGLKELAAVLGLQIALIAAIGVSGLPIRIPLTYVLMMSAATAVTGLLLPFVLLVTRCEQQATRTFEIARPATLALLGALLFIAAMAGGRFFLELVLGVSSQVAI